MLSLLVAVLLALAQEPVPFPEPRTPPPRLPRPVPEPWRPRLPVPRPPIDPTVLTVAEPNVCKGKQDGFYCGTGRYSKVSYWCEAYTTVVRTECANGCNASSGMCNE